MVNYALDIENTRVLSAMEELGIVKEELILKTIEDFKDPRVPFDIQRMRYDHYNKMVRKAINDIKDLQKQRHVTIFPTESKHTLLNYTQGSQSHKNIPDLKKIPVRQQIILRNTLSTFNNPQKTEKKFKKPTHSDDDYNIEVKKNYKEIFKKYRGLQQVHYNDIKNNQLKSQKILGDQFSKSMKEHIEREMNNEKTKRLEAKRKEEMYQKRYEEIQYKKMMQEQMFEDAIAMKLEKFENKIQKSDDVRTEVIHERIERTLKLRENFEKAQKNYEERKKTNEVEILKKLVDKHDIVKKHRERNEEEIQRKAAKRKEKFEKLKSSALEKIKQADENFKNFSRKNEKNIIKAQQNVENRLQKINEEMLYRKEMKRLKDIECLIKVQRAKRRFGAKNHKSLQRTLDKYHKIDEYKMEKERQIYTARDTAIKAMIEKEKVQEAVAIIFKSPRSKTAQEKLKSLNILSRDHSSSDKDPNE